MQGKWCFYHAKRLLLTGADIWKKKENI